QARSPGAWTQRDRRDTLRVAGGRLLLLPGHRRRAGPDRSRLRGVRRAAPGGAARGGARGNGVRPWWGGSPAVVLRHGALRARAGVGLDPEIRGSADTRPRLTWRIPRVSSNSQ